MSENLAYLFKYHTKLKDEFFKDLLRWKPGKSAYKDLYMLYRSGVMGFIDQSYALFTCLYKNVSPDAAARLQKLWKSDEAVLYFLPFYNVRLFIDFCEVAQYISEELENNFNEAGHVYEEILRKFSIRVLVSYGESYNKGFDDVMAMGKSVLIDYSNYLHCAMVAKPKGSAEMSSAAEELLVSKLMEKFLAKDDEETRFFLNLHIAAFLFRNFPTLCKGVRAYYPKVWEIKEAVG